MDHDLGYFDDETCRLEPLANPFGPKVFTYVLGMKRNPRVRNGPPERTGKTWLGREDSNLRMVESKSLSAL